MTLAGAALVAFAPTVDLDRSHDFYSGVLGFEATERSSFANAYDANGTQLRVTRVNELTPQPFTVLGWKVADLEAAMAQLRDRGVEFRRFAGMDQDADGIWTAPSGTRVAWFNDPDENVLSVHS